MCRSETASRQQELGDVTVLLNLLLSRLSRGVAKRPRGSHVVVKVLLYWRFGVT